MAASDAVTGKVLCVIAGIAIARAVITKVPGAIERQAEASQLLDLADAWIDEPTDERFDQITAFLFDDERELTEPNDPLKVVWRALRIASSSVGNYEAGWALGMVVDDAMNANLDAVEIARMALESRCA